MAGNDFTSQSLLGEAVANRRNAGGLNSTASPISLRADEASDLQNIDFDKFGSFKKRKGYTQLNTTAFNSGAAGVGLHWFQQSDGSNFLVYVAGDKIGQTSSLTQAATPFTDITGSVVISADKNNHVDFAEHLDTLLMTNGVNPPWQWTGTGNAATMTVPTGLTKAKYVEVFSNFTFLGNVTVSGTDHPSRIYWSDIDTIATWSAADFRDVSKNDGQNITGLQTLGEFLVIFKERSIWVASFTGDSAIPFVFDKTRSSVGCVAGHSIEPVENGIVFLSDDGYYFFDGQNSTKMSDRVNVTIDGFSSTRFKNAVSIYNFSKNRYITSHTSSGSSTHDRNLTWDAFNNAWSFYKGINANAFARVYSSGDELIYFADYSGFVYKMDDGNNDNPSGTETAIDAFWASKFFDYSDLVSKKAVPELAIYFQFSSTTMQLGYSYNFETADQFTQQFSISAGGSLYGSGVYGTATYAGVGGGIVKRHLTGRGETVRFKFSNARLNETFTIDGFAPYPHLETNV